MGQRTEYRGWNDEERMICCRECQAEQRTIDAERNEAFCPSCDTRLCVFCGCTNTRGCVHPEFPGGQVTCEWVEAGVCSFCHFRIAEEAYLTVTGRVDQIRPPAETMRPLIMPAGSITTQEGQIPRFVD